VYTSGQLPAGFVRARAQGEGDDVVLRELFGLPAHALIVHAAVVFIPLAALAAVLYGVWPALRRHIWWAMLGLGVLAPVVGWVARLSGNEYKTYWLQHGAAGEFLDSINKHQSYGNVTSWLATALGLVMLATVLYAIPGPVAVGRPTGAAARVLPVVAAVASVALAAVTLYYVILTGDAGAHATHPEL
jgi:hypothetical protein